MPSASGMYSRSAAPMHPAVAQQTSKSRRLYIGNVPYHAGLTDVALTQFFSALYVAGFRANKPGEPLPVISFWLHSDGKFGFMELRGEQEAVNMMQFNGIFLHGRPLRVNRPSDYRPEVHNPSALNLVPEMVNVEAVMELCEKLGGVTAAPTQLISLAATKPLTSTMPNSPNKEPSVPMETTEKKGPISSETKAPTPCSDSQLDKDIKVESESQASSQEKGKEDVTKAGVETVDAVVVSLQNLITDADVEGNDEEYEDIVADVRAECESYSKVESVSIPRTGIWKGCAFVEFKDSVGAKKAMKSLSTRVFDGRQILAIAVEGCKTAAEAAARPGGK